MSTVAEALGPLVTAADIARLTDVNPSYVRGFLDGRKVHVENVGKATAIRREDAETLMPVIQAAYRQLQRKHCKRPKRKAATS